MKNFLVTMSIAVFSIYTALAGQPAQVKLNVKGMHCSGCENKVKQALSGIDGVTATKSVSADAGSAEITIDKSVTTEEKVATQLAEKTGYEVNIVGANSSSSCPKSSCSKSNNKNKCCTSGATSPACTPNK